MNNNFSIGSRFADLAYGEDKNRIRRSLNASVPNSPGASGNPSGAGVSEGARAAAPTVGSDSSPSGVSAAAGKTAAAGEHTAKSGQAAESGADVSGAGIALDFSNKNLINSVILSEILGKPKFLRKGRW